MSPVTAAFDGCADAGDHQVVLFVALGQLAPRASFVRDDVDALDSDVAEVGELVDAVHQAFEPYAAYA